MLALLFAALVTCAYASDTQHVKSVKGGQASYQYKGGDVTRFYGFNNTQQGSGASQDQNLAAKFEVGVCYKEVPTASLARDPAHIPVGNGSRSDLSRIRTCCPGYKRNVYNFRICDPVCTSECINGLCTAPDTCTCYPDHVRNLAGFCVATCPIGCQNGYCAGGECLCKEGYKLDRDSKFCVPNCGPDCDRIGNCTAPNTCVCKPGDTNPVCRGQPASGNSQPASGNNQPASGNSQPSYPHPNNPPQFITSRPSQDTIYVNPNPNQYPNIPINSYNQKKNDSSNPNQDPYQIPNPFPQSHYSPSVPNQQHLPNQPHQGPTPQQFGQNPQYPAYPINQNYPLYPGSQIAPNSTNPSNYGQQPQNPNNQFPQNPAGPNQGSFNPQYPPVQTFNVSIPAQYPLYPANQVGPNTPNHTPNQGGSPYHPSANQSPYPGYQTGYAGYPYPSNTQEANQPHQGGSYPYNRPMYPWADSTYPHGQNLNPSNPSGPYSPYGQQPNQNSFGQTQDASPLCSEPCVNGVCAENNQCRCNPGYVRDEDDTTGKRCLPHCPGGCLNGYCAAPYSCACNEGYSKDTSVKGRAICIKRIRRSADLQEPLKVAELMIFEIPENSDQ